MADIIRRVPVSWSARVKAVPGAEFVITLVTEKPLGAVGGFIVLAMVVAAVFANVIAPYSFSETHYSDALSSPGGSYLLGTDNLGRDLLSRIIFGARISIYVALGAVGLGMVYALGLGLAAAWFGGFVDTAIGTFIDAKLAIPTLLLTLVVAGVLGPGVGNTILVLSLFGINEARVVRGYALSVRQGLFVEAATATGAGSLRIILTHLLPNVFPMMIILASLRFGAVIIAEATLSFLGYGVPPPNPSWGGMLSHEARYYMQEAPWLAIVPGLSLTLAVWGFNTFGDALRDMLDPRMRGSDRMRYK